MYLLIDNYDSFTYNLWHFLGEMGATFTVHRNDELSVEEAMALSPKGIVLSPGPCDPDKAGICLDLVRAAAGKIPVLGVCLGHQSIAQALGGRVIGAPECMHGKVSRIRHTGAGIFHDIPSPLTATRYHSLIMERETLPDCFDITAETEDGIVMAIEHKEMPLFGVQFHPESIASEHGHHLLGNFLDVTRQ
jgi:anthranilate synthase component 2